MNVNIFRFKLKILNILIETFKWCTFIHNDGASIMEYDGGLDFDAISTRLVSGVTTNSDKSLSNQVKKWLDMFNMIYYINEEDQNTHKKTIYLKVLGMFCIK